MMEEKEEAEKLTFDLYEQQEKYKPKEPSKATVFFIRLRCFIAGMLMLIPGVISFLVALSFIIGGIYFLDDGFLPIMVGIIQLPFAISGIVGGFLTIKRKKHRIAVTCAVLSIITFGNAIMYFIPGFLASFLVFISEDDFES